MRRVPNFRHIAERVFKFPDKFGAAEFLIWPEAQRAITGLLNDVNTGDIPDATAVARFHRLNSWQEFFLALSAHNFLSAEPDISEFPDLWESISGFDVDGLLMVGDPSGLATLKYQEMLARHAIGRRLINNGGVEDCSRLDHHVHFGQITDLGLLWHQHLVEESCRWSRYAPNLDPSPNFRIRAGLRMSTPGRGENPKPSSRNRWPDQVKNWAASMCKARLLFSYYLEHHETIKRDQDNEDALGFLYDTLMSNQVTGSQSDFSRDYFSDLEDKHEVIIEQTTNLSLGESIQVECRLIEGISGEAPLASAFAAAYLCLKCSAMHTVCCNAVRCFDSFRNALSVLDNIYGRKARIFDSRDAFIEISADHLNKGGGRPQRILYRATKKSMIISNDTLKHRSFADHWRTASKLAEDGRADIMLTFQREDFANAPQDFRDIKETVLERAKDWEEFLPCRIVGLDLCGPEVMDVARAGTNAAKLAPTALVLDPIEHVLDFRDELAAVLERPIHVSFHVGEHVVDWELGLLSAIAVLTHPRFAPDTDRISHALIFAIDRANWNKEEPITQAERDAAVTRIRRYVKRHGNGIFTRQELDQIDNVLEELIGGNSQPLDNVRKLVFQKVSTGKIPLEVCPYSNKMIKNIAPREHPWKPAMEQGRLLLGTDDPSLTQTLPWIELAALAS